MRRDMCYIEQSTELWYSTGTPKADVLVKACLFTCIEQYVPAVERQEKRTKLLSVMKRLLSRITPPPTENSA
jgi:hypothetical protein